MENEKWLKKYIKPKMKDIKQQKINSSKPFKKAIMFLFLFMITPLLLDLCLPESNPISKYLNSTGKIIFMACRDAISAPKPITIKLTYNNEGSYDLPKEIYMSASYKKRELKSELNGLEWILANAGDNYLDPTHAIDHFAKDFSLVPYTNFNGNRHSTNSDPRFTDTSLKVKAILKRFTDGKYRTIYLDETFFAFQANTHSLWRTDKRIKNHENIEPSEVLAKLLFKFSRLYNHEKNYWYEDEVKRWIAFQYAFAYGCSLDPEQIIIVGDKENTRFIYPGKIGISYTNNRELIERNRDTVYVTRKQPEKRFNGKIFPARTTHMPVYVKTDSDELCFYGSADPKQSLILPRSLVKEVKNSDSLRTYDFRGKEIVITFNNILNEHEYIRNHKDKRFISKGNEAAEYTFVSDAANYVVKNNDLMKVANLICDGSENKLEAIQRLVDVVQVPYYSDTKKSLTTKTYGGPNDVPLPFFSFMLNGGGDCEDHANGFTSLFISAKNKFLSNEIAATGLMDYDKEALHIIPLIAVDWETKTFPFNNHFIDPVSGKPLFYIEVTGKYPVLGTCMPNLIGYETLGIKPFGAKKWYDTKELKCVLPEDET